MISFKINPESLKNLEVAIGRKVAEATAITASVAYNAAIHQDEPRWSGLYNASWDIAIGKPSDRVLAAPSVKFGKPDVTYQPPYNKFQEPYYQAPFTPIYVSNTAKHAYKVEYEGTRTHPQGGWMIAAYAKNQALQKFKLF